MKIFYKTDLNSTSSSENTGNQVSSEQSKLGDRVADLFAQNVVLAQALLKTGDWETMPKPDYGKTFVVMPPDIPVVIKDCSDFGLFHERVEHAAVARQICQKEKLDRVVVPRSSLHGMFVIAERLPIKGDVKSQMGLYLSQTVQFNEAVVQLVRFLMKAHVGDISGETTDPFQAWANAPMGRHDNICLYIEDGIGKIGLVDLEDFIPHGEISDSFAKFHGMQVCRDLVTLFPNHLETILQTVCQENPALEICEEFRQQLETYRQETLERMEKVYTIHKTFLDLHDISTNNPLQLVKIIPERMQEITAQLTKVVQADHQRGCYEDCLGQEPDQTIERFKVVVPKLIGILQDFFAARMQRKQGRQEIADMLDVLRVRTVKFKKDDYPLSEVIELLGVLDIYESQKELYAHRVINKLLSFMTMGGDLAYYDGSFGEIESEIRCVFI